MSTDLLLLEEVAARVRAPVSSIRNWIASGKLRSMKPGKRRLVCVRDLEAMLQASVHPASPKVEESGGKEAAQVAGHCDETGMAQSVEGSQRGEE